MTEISHDNVETIQSYYLPHHGVFKEDSLTTKLRVVFDGSCPSTSGYSLNELQLIGPKLQNDILDVLLRFRYHKYVVSADISKMYRQILMHKEHRSLQRIIWRDDPSKDLSTYQLNTVTYGTSSAPYLAIRCLQQLAHDNKISYPLASQTILNDFYVDDLLTGSDDLDELNDTCKNIFLILKGGGFILRKWVTNVSAVLSGLVIGDITNAILTLGENENSKTLGIQWYNQLDILKYHVPNLAIPEVISKRSILADIAHIYDPLGLLSPCIILFKILIQTLWSQKLSWDDPVPHKCAENWIQLRKNLSTLNEIEIPRRAIESESTLIDLHCFCDASQAAYATCIYLRSQNPQGKYFVHLLCAKTKVAPVKCITIPRLELCAALLGAQLVKKTISSLKTSIPCFFWTDSQVALAWIHSEPNRFQVFVSNRISQIQSLSNPKDWYYVNTKQNPADLASRGVQPQLLKCTDIWWHGPPFLLQDESCWPLLRSDKSESELIELKPVTKVHTLVMHNDIFTRFSCFNKLKRIVAYCLRFLANTHLPILSRNLGPLLVSEMNTAFFVLVKLSQKDSFLETINLLNANKPLQKNNNLVSLAPFLDSQNILRVGGRLQLSSVDSNVKHPILLAAKLPLTKLIFSYKHIDLLHAGPQLLLANIRETLWVIGGRNLAKQTVHECIRCFKFKPTFASCPMGQLPKERVNPSFPFEITGIDYAGPYLIKDRKLRTYKLVKCYMCVFVCFCTKALHLELVSDLTSECFLACLKRFCSRRGIPAHIYSDNGTTFVGAKNELSEFTEFLKNNSDAIVRYCTSNNTSWHFIPPYAPNFGGLWEAAVKSAKYHLKRSIQNATLTFEELNSLIIQIEGILNSRPLFAMSDDPNDLQPICPSHFLLGRAIKSLPEYNFEKVPENRLSSLELIQKFKQQFWSRFSKEYITQLSRNYKWRDAPTKIKPGVLVLIQDDKQPSNHWLMGRILNLISGKDGVSRVAVIKTSDGIIKRAVRRLCPLPLQEETI